MKTIIVLIFLLASCSNSDMGRKFSFSDPFYLSKGQSLVSCDTPIKLPISNLEVTLNYLYNKYSHGQNFDYRSLYSQQSDQATICNTLAKISKTNLDLLSINSKASFLINTYNLLVIHLITKYYDQVQFPGKPQLPEYRSILNIEGRGNKIWTDLKWFVAGAYRSLAEIENDLLFPIVGPNVHLLLSRGTRGFQSPYKTAFTSLNIRSRLHESAVNFVNRVSFFDDAQDNDLIIITPEIINTASNHFGPIRDFFSQYLDQEIIGIKIDKNELFKFNNNQNKFLWNFEYEPTNWAINETVL